MSKQREFEKAVKNNNVNTIKDLLNDNSANPAWKNSWAFRYAAKKGYFEIIRVLLKNKKANPANSDNRAVKYAYKHKHYFIVTLLLNDKRVKKSLENSIKPYDINFYKKARKFDVIEKARSF